MSLNVESGDALISVRKTGKPRDNIFVLRHRLRRDVGNMDVHLFSLRQPHGVGETGIAVFIYHGFKNTFGVLLHHSDYIAVVKDDIPTLTRRGCDAGAAMPPILRTRAVC